MMGLTPDYLRRVEAQAIQTVNYMSTSKDLTLRKVDHSWDAVPYHTSQATTSPEPTQQPGLSVPTLFVRSSRLFRNTPDTSEPFVQETLRLECHGFDNKTGMVRSILQGVLKEPENLHEMLAATPNSDVAFYKDGMFSVALLYPFGTSCVSKMIGRLNSIGQIRSYVRTMKKHKLKTQKFSINEIAFAYHDSPTLTANINFIEGIPVRFGLSTTNIRFAASNPHRRIQSLCEAQLNASSDGFEQVIHLLRHTLPLMQAFEAIEQRAVEIPSPQISVTIHLRSIDKYRLTYAGLCTFDIILRKNRDLLEWHVEDILFKQPLNNRRSRAEELKTPLEELFKDHGDGWEGMKSALVCRPNAVETALLKLDGVIRQAKTTHESDAVAQDAGEQHDVITLD